jgi:carbamoyltransferase
MTPLVAGISCFFHDAAAALVHGDAILAAAEEERFSRHKHDAGFPADALAYCLTQAPDGRRPDMVVFYEDPALKADRLLSCYADTYPGGMADFAASLRSFAPKWKQLPGLVAQAVGTDIPLRMIPHHLSHAASAFYPSPFEEAAILVVDGVGEWATTTIGVGRGTSISLIDEVSYPHSLGMIYSVFTQYCGFKINSGEYKLMGLAPFGTPRYAGLIRDHVISLHPDGSFHVNPEYVSFHIGDRMYSPALIELLGRPAREEETRIDAFYADIAASIQAVTEDAMLGLAAAAKRATGARHLTMAGGVALNCVANGRLLRSGLFDGIWVQPAAGDAGGALGAALAGAMDMGSGRERNSAAAAPRPSPARRTAAGSSQGNSLLGPAFDDDAITQALHAFKLVASGPLDTDARCRRVADLLADGAIVARFQGRMEFGPRALGNRSILGDPRRPDIQSRINMAVKFRESWRPFAPAVMAEFVSDWFDPPVDDPYMLFVSFLRPELRRNEETAGEWDDDIIRRVQAVRSSLPAITHIDFSARVQAVEQTVNPGFWKLLDTFRTRTGCPVLVNTSFNVRGEPIVCTPGEALRCFLASGIDALEIGSYLLLKSDNIDIAATVQPGGGFALD